MRKLTTYNFKSPPFVLLVILLAVLIAAYLTTKSSGTNYNYFRQCQNTNNLLMGIETYKKMNGTYPVSLENLEGAGLGKLIPPKSYFREEFSYLADYKYTKSNGGYELEFLGVSKSVYKIHNQQELDLICGGNPQKP